MCSKAFSFLLLVVVTFLQFPCLQNQERKKRQKFNEKKQTAVRRGPGTVRWFTGNGNCTRQEMTWIPETVTHKRMECRTSCIYFSRNNPASCGEESFLEMTLTPLLRPCTAALPIHGTIARVLSAQISGPR